MTTQEKQEVDRLLSENFDLTRKQYLEVCALIEDLDLELVNS